MRNPSSPYGQNRPATPSEEDAGQRFFMRQIPYGSSTKFLAIFSRDLFQTFWEDFRADM